MKGVVTKYRESKYCQKCGKQTSKFQTVPGPVKVVGFGLKTGRKVFREELKICEECFNGTVSTSTKTTRS